MLVLVDELIKNAFQFLLVAAVAISTLFGCLILKDGARARCFVRFLELDGGVGGGVNLVARLVLGNLGERAFSASTHVDELGQW